MLTAIPGVDVFGGLVRLPVGVLGVLAAATIAVPVVSHATTTPATTTTSPGVITALPDLAVDMNDVGEVLMFHGSVWSSSTKTTTSPTVPSGVSYNGYGINSAGVVIGLESLRVPAFWQVGVSTTLTPIDLTGLRFSNGETVGYVGISGIDDAGDAFGYALSTYVDGQPTQMAGLLIPGHAGVPSGPPQLVTTIDGTAIEYIVAMNSKYEVVGDASSGHEGEQLALVDTTAETVTQTNLALHEGKTASRLLNATGSIAELTQAGADATVRNPNGAEFQLAGGASGATATDGLFLNSSDQVAGNVGPIGTQPNGPPHAELWAADGSATVLDDTLPASASGWSLQYAEGLDDKDDIAGTGTLNGVQTGFFLQLQPRSYPPVVNSTADTAAIQSGAQGCWTGQNVTINGAPQPECTLRAAIEAENAGSVDETTITFALPTDGDTPGVITPTSVLPALKADGVTIDGTWNDSTVTLLGSALAGTSAVLEISGGHDVVQNVSICQAPTGVLLDGKTGHGVVRAVTMCATASAGKLTTGILVKSPSNTIGGSSATDRNVIASATFAITVTGISASGNSVIGNWLDVSTDGKSVVGVGIGSVRVLDAPNTVVGGVASTPGAAPGNVALGGVEVFGQAATVTGVKVQGNLIGLMPDGTAPPTTSGLVWGVDVAGSVSGVLVGGAGGARNVVTGASHDEINIQGLLVENATIENNLIGTDPTGANPMPVARADPFGISIAGSHATSIGAAGLGNDIASQERAGIDITAAAGAVSLSSGSAPLPGTGDKVVATSTGTVIRDNTIGPAADGRTLDPTTVPVSGVRLNGINDTVGPGNQIAGNSTGVLIQSGSKDETLIGNDIGTDPTGTTAVPNGVGISISSHSSGAAVDTIGVPGSQPNVISGNLADVVLTGAATMQNNKIGTVATGLSALAPPATSTLPPELLAAAPGGKAGPLVSVADTAAGTLIGGSRPGFGNVISGSSSDGLVLDAPATVQGNEIGVGANGTTPVANAGNGIVAGAPTVVIGPAAPGGSGASVTAGGNTIADNKSAGVAVTSTGVTVLSNAIFGNASAGIATGTAAPVVTAAAQDGQQHTIVTVAGPANATVQVYRASGCASHPQGTAVSATGTTDSTGNGTIALPLQEVGTALDATTTTAKGTSSFSGCAAVAAAATGIVTKPVGEAGQTDVVDGAGFSAGEAVQATLHSAPVSLGRRTADGSGAVSFTFTVPKSVPAGQHYVFLTGAQSGKRVAVPVIVHTAPSVPRSFHAKAGKALVALAWSAPASNGGTTITGYRVLRSTNGKTWRMVKTTASRSWRDVKLVGGRRYYFEVEATNAVGASAATSRVSSTPYTPPSTPRSLHAKAGRGTITLAWRPPAHSNGAAVTAYVVQYAACTIGARHCAVHIATVHQSRVVLRGLTAGRKYHLRVTAVNKAGRGTPSPLLTAMPTRG